MILRKLAASLALAAALAGVAGVWVHHRASLREAAAEAAWPATGRIVMVDGVSVHVHIEGEGPDLILIHGASGNLRDFTFALTARLRDRYRIIAFDRPGLGWTGPLPRDRISPADQAALLRKAADQLGVQNPIVLGHSFGGAVALAWALDAPEPPAALVLVSAASMPWEGGIWFFHQIAGTRLGGAVVVPFVTAFAGADTAENALTGIFAPDPVPVGYLAHIGADLTLRRSTLRANSAQVNGLLPHIVTMSARYPSLTLPVELIHGDTDTTVPLTIHSLPLSRQLPDAALTVLPGTGHMPHHAHQDQIIAAIDRAALRAGLR